jgi:hypothetical protein
VEQGWLLRRLIKDNAAYWITQHRHSDMFLPDWIAIQHNKTTNMIDVKKN